MLVGFTLSPYFSTVPNSSDVQERFDAVYKTETNACEAACGWAGKLAWRNPRWRLSILDKSYSTIRDGSLWNFLDLVHPGYFHAA